MVTLQAPNQFARFAMLEVWRSIAALAVFASHAIMIFALPLLPSSSHIAAMIEAINVSIGSSSVAIFFVISGIVIRNSIERHSGDGQFALRPYLVSRANRILPPFWAALLISILAWMAASLLLSSPDRLFTVMAAGPLPHPGLEISCQELVATALFLNSVHFNTIQINSPLWSLSYEVWLYIWAAGFGWCSARLRPLRPGRYALMAAGLLLFTLIRPHFGFMGGIWMAGFAVADWKLGRAASAQLPHWLVQSLQIVLGFVFVGNAVHAAFTAEHIRLGGMIVEFFAGLAFCAMFAQRETNGPARPRTLLSAVSGYSYTLYIFHMPLFLVGFAVIAEGRVYTPLLALLGIPAAITVLAFAATVGKRIESVRPFRFGAVPSR